MYVLLREIDINLFNSTKKYPVNISFCAFSVLKVNWSKKLFGLLFLVVKIFVSLVLNYYKIYEDQSDSKKTLSIFFSVAKLLYNSKCPSVS